DDNRYHCCNTKAPEERVLALQQDLPKLAQRDLLVHSRLPQPSGEVRRSRLMATHDQTLVCGVLIIEVHGCSKALNERHVWHRADRPAPKILYLRHRVPARRHALAPQSSA